MVTYYMKNAQDPLAAGAALSDRSGEDPSAPPRIPAAEMSHFRFAMAPSVAAMHVPLKVIPFVDFRLPGSQFNTYNLTT